MIDPTELTPEQWRQYLTKARTALHENPKDEEALQAITDANQALSVYDQAEAASPGERITSGLEGGIAGLGQAALDIPRGIAQAVMHPIQTIENIPKIPGAIAQGLSSDDPEQVARTVGNVGSALLPFAKAGKAAPVMGALRRGAGAPFRAAKSLMERPGLTNELLRLRIARMGGEPGVAPEAEAGGIEQEMAQYGTRQPKMESSAATRTAVSDIGQARRDFLAGKISAQDYETATKFARGEPTEEAAQPISAGAPGSGKPVTPIAGVPKGFTAEGPPTPPVPTAPTAAEMVTGQSNAPAEAAAAETRQVANSHKELQALIKQGVPRENIKINYWTRGGKLQQTVPPKPSVSPTGPTSSPLAGETRANLMKALWTPGIDTKLLAAVRQELIRRTLSK